MVGMDYNRHNPESPVFILHQRQDKKITNGGEITMSRTQQPKAKNLVEEAKGKESKGPKSVPVPKDPEPQVQVIPDSQFFLNHLVHIIDRQNEMHEMIVEGFKQVGVNFEEKKA